MKIISVFAPKGGVSKTTTTLHLADCLSLSFGKQVLVYDSDPQKSLIEAYYKDGDFSFDATGEFPREIGQYDYVIVDYEPTVLLTEQQRKLLKISDVVVCPSDIDRASLKSANAVKKLVDPGKIINLFPSLDGQDKDQVELAAKFPDYFVINKTKVISRAIKACRTVFQSNSNSKYIKRAKEQITALASHIEAIRSIR